MSEPDREPQGQLTVGVLVEMLQKLDPSWLVFTQGCDCIGPSDGVEFENGSVLINRNDDLESHYGDIGEAK